MTKETHSVDPCARNWVWRSIQLLMQNIFVFWLQYRVAGKEHLPAGGAMMLVNHTSFIDPLLVGVSLKRPVSFLARHELFSVPIIGWILKNTYVMPIRREAAGTESIRLCVERLNQGYYVGLFPEGTRSKDGRLQEIKPGFLAIIRRAKVPVIPVCIAGAGEAYPRGAIFLKPNCVRVIFGEPFTTEQVAELSSKGREAEFIALITERMEDCLNQANHWRAGIPPRST